MTERLLMRFRDGPLQGDRLMLREWPLPDVIPAPDWVGAYRKVHESTMKIPKPGTVRGAEYRWDAEWRLEGAPSRNGGEA